MDRVPPVVRCVKDNVGLVGYLLASTFDVNKNPAHSIWLSASRTDRSRTGTQPF